MTPTWTPAQRIQRFGPFVMIVLTPLLPLIVLLADVLPRGVALAGRGFALGLAAVMACAFFAVLIALLVDRGWRALIAPPVALPLLAMVATSLLAGLIGVSLRASSFEILTEVGDFLAFVTIYWTMQDVALRRKLLGAFFGSAIAATLFAIALTLSRHPPEMFAYQHGRAAGTFLQPNELGGYLLFVIALGLAQGAAPAWLRRLGVSAACIGIIALALSVSRAAWLGLLVGLPVLVWRYGRRAAVAYVFAAAVTLVLASTTFRDVAHDPSENTSRIAVWRGAARIAERFALTGAGPLSFSKVYPSLKQPDAAVDEVHAHDLALNILVENGVLGLAAFGWAVVAGIRAALDVRTRLDPADREPLLLFYGLAAAFIASAVQNVLDVVSTFVFLLWWPMLGLMLSLAPAAGSAGSAQDAAHGAARRARAPRAAGAALASALALAGCGGHPSAAPTANAQTPLPQPPYYVVAQSVGGQPVELREIAHGQLEYLLRANRVEYATADSKGTLSGVLLLFYKGRTERLRVTAPTAQVLPTSRNVSLAGGVRASSANGAAMAAQNMEYDGIRHVLVATGHVSARDGRGNSLDGDRAEADLDLRKVHVFGPNGEQTITVGQ